MVHIPSERVTTQLAFTCLKIKIEALEIGAKYGQMVHLPTMKDLGQGT